MENTGRYQYKVIGLRYISVIFHTNDPCSVKHIYIVEKLVSMVFRYKNRFILYRHNPVDIKVYH